MRSLNNIRIRKLKRLFRSNVNTFSNKGIKRVTNNRSFRSILGIIYEVVVRVSLLALLLFFLVAFVREIKVDRLVISNFELPENLKAQGYTSRGVSERILFEMQTIRQQSLLAGGFDYTNVDADLVEAQVSVGDFNITSLFKFIKKFLGRSDREISGFVQSYHTRQKLTLRIDENLPTSKSSSLEEFDSLLVWAAEEIMKQVDPLNLGDSYIRREKLVEAKELVARLKNQKIARSDEKAFFLEAQIFRKEGDYLNVSIAVDRLLRLNPNHGGGLLIKAKNYYAQLEDERIDHKKMTKSTKENLRQKGIFCLKKIIEKELTDPEAEESLNSEEVKENLRNAAYILWAVFETKEGGDRTHVKQLMQMGLGQNPSAENCNNTAYTFLLIDSLDIAEIYVKKAVEMEPNEMAFWDTYAELRVKQKNYSEMYKCLEKAFQGRTTTRVKVEDYLEDKRFAIVHKQTRFKELVNKYKSRKKTS